MDKLPLRFLDLLTLPMKAFTIVHSLIRYYSQYGCY